MISAFFLLLTAGVFLSTMTTLPVSLGILVAFYVFLKKPFVVGIGAITAGLFIDLLKLYPLGQTSMIFLLVLVFISLYERKFEVATVPFVGASSLVGTIGFVLAIGYEASLIELATSSAFGMMMFAVLSLFKKA